MQRNKIDGYISGDELDNFKRRFRSRLENVARKRKSYKNIPKPHRRLDSLARLLEGEATCSAVYCNINDHTLKVACNKIFWNSKSKNKHIDHVNFAFQLISDEKLTLDEIIQKLAILIEHNVSQRYWQSLKLLKVNKINLNEFISEKLYDLFQSGNKPGQWKINTINELDDDQLKSIFSKIIKRTTKMTNDFLKLRDFLLDPKSKDPLSISILTAIKNQNLKIMRIEGKGVHAEMRLLSLLLPNNKKPDYIGISRLCCDHCALAMESFKIQVRGLHGQRNNWPIPSFFIDNNEKFLKLYLGQSIYNNYRNLNNKAKVVALSFIESEKSNSINETSGHGRHMDADTSESEVDFCPSCSDDESYNELYDFTLQNIWQLRNIKCYYREEFDNLINFNLNLTEIVGLFTGSLEDFKSLASNRLFDIINEIAVDSDKTLLEIFEEFKNVYYKDNFLFNKIIEDENNLVVTYGIVELQQRWHQDDQASEEEVSEEFFEPEEESNLYARIAQEEAKDAWDYDSNSDDSENYYTYKDDVSDMYSAPRELEYSFSSEEEKEFLEDDNLNSEFKQLNIKVNNLSSDAFESSPISTSYNEQFFTSTTSNLNAFFPTNNKPISNSSLITDTQNLREKRKFHT